MRGKGVLGESSRRRSFSKKTKRVINGKVKGTSENVVLIDLDDDNVVIIDDAPESLHKNFATSEVPRDRGKSSAVIHIDDDEDDDTGVGVGISVEVDGDLASDASSSKTPFPPFKSMGSSVHRDMDECEFVTEKTTAFQFSKCKQTYCTKSPAKNRYGLGPTFGYNPTDSDSSDCEIVADSHGEIREQWEIASSRKKKDVQNRHSGLEGQSSASESNNEARTNYAEENGKEQQPSSGNAETGYGKIREQWERDSSRKKKHVQNRHSGLEDQSSASESNSEARTNHAEERGKEQHPSSGNADCMKENQPEFVASDGGYEEAASASKTSSESFFVDVDQISEENPESVLEKETIGRNKDFQSGGGSVSVHCHNGDVRQTNEDAFDGIPGSKNKEPSLQESFKVADDGNVTDDCYFCKKCKSYQNVCDCIPAFWDDKEPSAQGPPFEEEGGDKQATPPKTCSMEKGNLDSGQAFVPNSRLFGGGSEDFFSRCVSAERKSEDKYGKGCRQDDMRIDSEGAAVHNSSCDQPSSLNESCFLVVKESNGSIECAQDVNVTPPVETCIVTGREKQKDTEEYKRAMEEEWAARRQELEIQAEEARKLRKRKKAETMRLCDIERRQKQRVEEVRETQKKNAENINLKDQLRGEIRKEINRLEITCIDMASLLRGLGIQVNGGFNPMSGDINAAYKRALLKFHPDRASRMDIRQQVEAEEKFKLISRMKEKFLTSC